MGFLPPDLHLLKPFRSRLRAMYGTDRQRQSMHYAHHTVAGYNKEIIRILNMLKKIIG